MANYNEGAEEEMNFKIRQCRNSANERQIGEKKVRKSVARLKNLGLKTIYKCG